MNSERHQVYFERNFFAQFTTDLRHCRGRIIIQSPFTSLRRINLLFPEFRACRRRGVLICVFVQKQTEPERVQEQQSCIQLLRSMGIHDTVRERVHEKLALIDENIFWEGSLNICSHNRTYERMNRWESREKVRSVLEAHRLNLCRQCTPPSSDFQAHQRIMIGESITRRRKLLGLTQAELALKCGLHQHVISEIESAKRDAKLSTLSRINAQLNLELRSTPAFLMSAIDHLLNSTP